jgi:hypothetical protein
MMALVMVVTTMMTRVAESACGVNASGSPLAAMEARMQAVGSDSVVPAAVAEPRAVATMRSSGAWSWCQ